MSNDQPLLSIERVGKKFCRSLRRSIWYGIQDMTREALQLPVKTTHLRPDEFWALHDVSFDIDPGQCVGIIGPNGAGKSTFLKLLSGIFPPDLGRITVRGRLASLIEIGAGFHPMLSGRENIYVQGAILGMRKKEIDRKLDTIIAFAELEPFIDMPVRHYSSGMYVRLGFAIATQLHADILLLDEILAVGDVRFRMQCFEHILQAIRCGTAVIVVSHSMFDLARVAERGIVLLNGEIRFSGPLDEAAQYYYRAISISDRDTSETGLQGASIGNAWTTDLQGKPRTSFHTGETMQLVIELESTRLVPSARVIVEIRSRNNRDLTVAAISSRHQNFPLTLQPGRTQIAFVLPDLPLLRGAYTFTISLYGDNIADFYHRRINIAKFRITNDREDLFGYGVHGLVDLQHYWHGNLSTDESPND